MLPKRIRYIPEDAPPVEINTEDYVRIKTKNLKEFGYADLTEAVVQDQVEKVLAGDPDLTIIGRFIKGEINTIKEGKT